MQKNAVTGYPYYRHHLEEALLASSEIKLNKLVSGDASSDLPVVADTTNVCTG